MTAVEALTQAIRAAEAQAEQVYDRDGGGSHHLRGFLIPPRAFMALIHTAAVAGEGRPLIETVWSTDEVGGDA